MNAILGVSRLLEDTRLNDEQTRFLQMIKTSGNLSLTIISDILDLSRIEHNTLDLEKRAFSLTACIEDTIHLLYDRIVSKHLDLAYIIDRDVPSEVIADKARIQQIILNLIGNACKFTDDYGGVMIRVSVARAAESLDSCHLTIEVSDTGIGMTVETQQRLFQPFSQGDSSIVRRYGGTGLGLAIVKRLVEAMNGEITCRSTIGKGTVFTSHLTLLTSPTFNSDSPLETVDILQQSPSASPSASPQAMPRNISVSQYPALNNAIVWLICHRDNTTMMLNSVISGHATSLHIFPDDKSALMQLRLVDSLTRPRLVVIDVPSVASTTFHQQLTDAIYQENSSFNSLPTINQPLICVDCNAEVIQSPDLTSGDSRLSAINSTLTVSRELGSPFHHHQLLELIELLLTESQANGHC